MDSFDKKVLAFARDKSIREQRNVSVIKITDGSYYYVQPTEYVSPDQSDIVKEFKTTNFSKSEIQSMFQDIEKHANLSEGMHVLIENVDDEDMKADQIVRVSKRQIVCKSGRKFKRSDGTEWGGSDDESEKMVIAKKRIQ